MSQPLAPRVRSPKRWSLRILALVLGFLPLIGGELVLRLTGWPQLAPAIDPLVDLHHLRPLFTLSSDGSRYAVGPERLDLFREANFSATKPAGTFRIFALGGSTAQGEPYSTPTAYPAWMGLDLQAASGRTIEVINCGGLSYASYRVRAILLEVLKYEPDLIVIYCGQNEFLEARTYQGWRDVPLPIATASSWLSSLKVAQLTRYLVQGTADRSLKPAPGATQLQHEVDALLDYKGGLDAYHRNDPWREPVVAHFHWNLEQMVDHCQAANVPVILMNPVVNLLDCPPMKFETRSDLSPEQRAEFEIDWSAAQAHASEPQVARLHLERAYAIDPDHAGVNFFLGRLTWETGDMGEARLLLQRAKDQDVCPLRALTSIQDAVKQVAAQHDVPLVDADQLFIERSPDGLVGNKWLVDHIHPSIDGHQLLGKALCELVLKSAWLAEQNVDWRETQKDRIRTYLSSLGEDYYHRGKQRLEGLMLWTQGRAKKLR